MGDVKQYDVRFSQEGLANALEVWGRLKMNPHINPWEWKNAGPGVLTYVTPRLPYPEWSPGHEVLDGAADRDLGRECSRVFTLLYRHALSLADDGVLYTDAHPANIMLGPGGRALLIDPKRAIAWADRAAGEDDEPGGGTGGWEPEFAETPDQSRALLIGYAICCVAESAENYVARVLAPGRGRAAVERAMAAANQARAVFEARFGEALETTMPVSIWGRTAWHHTLSPGSPVQMNVREALATMGITSLEPDHQPPRRRRHKAHDGGRWDRRERRPASPAPPPTPPASGEQESTRPWLSFSWARK